MIFCLIGISYKTANLSVRESLYQCEKDIYKFWAAFSPQTTILFTCNRIEIYFFCDNDLSFLEILGRFVKNFPQVLGKLYTKVGIRSVIKHALNLACGVESQILGEKEILFQLKSWVGRGDFPQPCARLWGKILQVAESIRLRLELESKVNNIAKFVLEDLTAQLPIKKSYQVAILGTGKVAQLFGEQPLSLVKFYFAARKNHSRAKALARGCGGSIVVLDKLSELLVDADALITVSSSPHYLFNREYFIPILKRRKNTLFIYDLAVPRDLSPQVKSLPGICLKDTQDLDFLFFQQNKKIGNLWVNYNKFIEDRLFDLLGEVAPNEKNDKSRHTAESFSFSAG